MSYKISYDRTTGIQLKHEEREKCLRLRSFVISIWLLVAALSIFKYRDWVKDVLIPGNDTVTAAAFDELVNNVRGGTDIKESVAVFCEEILSHAQIPG